MRPDNRTPDQLRPLTLTAGVSRHAEGSCLIECGYTKVLCTASVEEHVPPFLRNSGKGWVTGEYGMLPRSTGSRNGREAARGKQSGRTQEIQRLIGRSLRSVVDMKLLGERQIVIDCDVIEADGGTRTASITGGYVALKMAIDALVRSGLIGKTPLTGQIAAVSCGVYKNTPVLDVNYEEDSNAEVDANFIMTSDGRIVEIQGTGEERPFTVEEYNEMLRLAQKGIAELCEAQNAALKNAPAQAA